MGHLRLFLHCKKGERFRRSKRHRSGKSHRDKLCIDLEGDRLFSGRRNLIVEPDQDTFPARIVRQNAHQLLHDGLSLPVSLQRIAGII
jgi:hypothetical protein